MTAGRTATDDTEIIRVFVVDDHAMVRKGIETFLRMVDDIELVGEASEGEEAIRRMSRLEADGDLPDVVLMDLVMPGTSGVSATETLINRHPQLQVIAMTSFAETARVHRALEAGAAGFILKDAEADELAAAIRSVSRGELHLDPAVTRELIRSLEGTSKAPAEHLTDREEEVLSLVAQGFSNLQIAKALFISERTARSHVSNIIMKLGVESRTQAALWAIRHGRGNQEESGTNNSSQ